MTDHLTREQLLNYLDGELPRAKMRAAGNHVQSCWACRTELERLQTDIGLIRDAQAQVLLPNLPPPPQPWPRLEPRLAAAEHSRLPDLHHIRKIFHFIQQPVPVVTVLASLVALAAFLWLSPISVSAKEILRRVSDADITQKSPPPDHFVRESVRVTKTSRSSHARQTGHVDSWRSAKNGYWQIAPMDTAARNLQERYRRQDLQDAPLSSPAFKTWTDDAGSDGRVAARSNDLTVQFVSSRASRPDGLESVSLRVRQSDWHVTNMQPDFADAQFEIAEEGLSVVTRSEVPPDVLAVMEPRDRNPEPAVLVARATVPTPAAPIPTARDLDDAEIDVRFTLHQIGSDLGDPIEIAQDANGIVVRASAVPSAKQEMLKRLLQDKPNVQLDLRPPASSASPVDVRPQIVSSRPPVAPSPERRAEQERLSKWFGDPKAQEDFARSVLGNSTDLLARLYAVKELRDRWPVDTRGHLSDQSRQELTTMFDDNVGVAIQRCTELALMVRPLANDLTTSGDSDALQAAAGADQVGVATALDKAKDVDLLLRSVFTTSASNTPLTASLLRIRQELGQIERTIRSLIASKP